MNIGATGTNALYLATLTQTLCTQLAGSTCGPSSSLTASPPDISLVIPSSATNSIEVLTSAKVDLYDGCDGTTTMGSCTSGLPAGTFILNGANNRLGVSTITGVSHNYNSLETQRFQLGGYTSITIESDGDVGSLDNPIDLSPTTEDPRTITIRAGDGRSIYVSINQNLFQIFNNGTYSSTSGTLGRLYVIQTLAPVDDNDPLSFGTQTLADLTLSTATTLIFDVPGTLSDNAETLSLQNNLIFDDLEIRGFPSIACLSTSDCGSITTPMSSTSPARLIISSGNIQGSEIGSNGLPVPISITTTATATATLTVNDIYISTDLLSP